MTEGNAKMRLRASALLLAVAFFTASCTAVTWGANGSGQLGLGTTERALAPTTAGEGMIDISAGGHHTCWIPDDRSMWCAGEGGTGSASTAPSPIRVGADNDWAEVEAGYSHTCAIRLDRSLWCWGSQTSEHQLFPGTDDAVVVDPRLIAPGSAWKAVSAGTIHTCGIQSDDSLWCWGGNEFSLIGDGTDDPALAPVRVGEASWRSVGASLTTTCGVRLDRTLWCWGDFAYITGTDGNDIEPSPIPMSDATTWDVVDGSNGLLHTCASRTDHSLWCWGANFSGALGDGTTTTAIAPTAVTGPSDWRSFSVGGSHTCGIRLDATLWCWGGGNDSQLGLGAPGDVLVPTRIGTEADWIRVDAGWNHTAGLQIPETPQ